MGVATMALEKMRFDLNGLQLLSLNGCNVLFGMLKWFTQYLAALQTTGELR